MTEKLTVYRVYPARVTLLSCCAVAIVAALLWSPWALLALPFIGLGHLCAAPNLNLADGFFVIVSILLGIGLLFISDGIGLTVILASSVSWFFSGFEKAMTCKPVEASSEKNHNLSSSHK